LREGQGARAEYLGDFGEDDVAPLSIDRLRAREGGREGGREGEREGGREGDDQDGQHGRE